MLFKLLKDKFKKFYNFVLKNNLNLENFYKTKLSL